MIQNVLNDIDILQKRVGEQIKFIRESKGIKNYEKFAIRNDLDRAHYWRIEKGEANLTLKTLCNVLNKLDTKIEDFFQQLAERNESDSSETHS